MSFIVLPSWRRSWPRAYSTDLPASPQELATRHRLPEATAAPAAAGRTHSRDWLAGSRPSSGTCHRTSHTARVPLVQRRHFSFNRAEHDEAFVNRRDFLGLGREVRAAHVGQQLHYAVEIHSSMLGHRASPNGFHGRSPAARRDHRLGVLVLASEPHQRVVPVLDGVASCGRHGCLLLSQRGVGRDAIGPLVRLAFLELLDDGPEAAPADTAARVNAATFGDRLGTVGQAEGKNDVDHAGLLIEALGNWRAALAGSRLFIACELEKPRPLQLDVTLLAVLAVLVLRALFNALEGDRVLPGRKRYEVLTRSDVVRLAHVGLPQC